MLCSVYNSLSTMNQLGLADISTSHTTTIGSVYSSTATSSTESAAATTAVCWSELCLTSTIQICLLRSESEPGAVHNTQNLKCFPDPVPSHRSTLHNDLQTSHSWNCRIPGNTTASVPDIPCYPRLVPIFPEQQQSEWSQNPASRPASRPAAGLQYPGSWRISRIRL